MTNSTTVRPDTLPSFKCAPWCKDGTGHTDARHPEDQFCISQSRHVTLIRETPIEGTEKGSRSLDYLGAYLVRERFEVEPFVQLAHNDGRVVDLTPTEARQLARVLNRLAATADKSI